MVEVPATSVVFLMAEHNLPDVELLKIGTEGFDPQVLRGAAEGFAAKKICVLQFENQKYGFGSLAYAGLAVRASA